MILRLDTPGGSVDVTKQIVQDMLASPVPVVVYVAPSAAQAGSAGTFITLAGHVAAMAPGSSIGAASPVGGQGEDIGDTMEAKVVNILSADIENLASRRGEEAVEWAVAAVQEAAAATDTRALEMGVIDFIATDVADLLDQMDGFVVNRAGSGTDAAHRQCRIMPQALSPLQEFLNFISNPTVATILLTLGSIGLIAEIYNPGTFIPGMIGLISLLLGLYSLGQLEANFAGLALIGLALILLVAEAFTPAFGALALGGTVAFIFGSALLFDAPGLAVPWVTIISLGVAMGAFALFVGGKVVAAQRMGTATGSEGVIGSLATVRVPLPRTAAARSCSRASYGTPSCAAYPLMKPRRPKSAIRSRSRPERATYWSSAPARKMARTEPRRTKRAVGHFYRGTFFPMRVYLGRHRPTS